MNASAISGAPRSPLLHSGAAEGVGDEVALDASFLAVSVAPHPAQNISTIAMATRSEVRLLPQNTNANVYVGRDPEESFCKFKY